MELWGDVQRLEEPRPTLVTGFWGRTHVCRTKVDPVLALLWVV